MGLGDSEILAFEQLGTRFAREQLVPHERRDDRYPFALWNHAAWGHAAALGLPGLALPERCGGTAQGMYAFARVLQITAAAEAGHATLLLSQALARATIAALRPTDDVLRAATLQGTTDEALIGFPLYDDPEESSTSVVATATPTGFTLHGTLPQVAALPLAETCLVPARLAGSDALSYYVVPVRASGARVEEPLVMLGLRACPTADFELSSVEVPRDARLEGAAVQFASAIERFRPAVVALSLGVLQASYELALNYARERKQGKRRIIEHHMVQELLSGMAGTLDLGALALPRACELADGAAAPDTALLSLQEIVTTLVSRATTDGVQALGGNGYMHDYGQEKHMRDAKQLQALLGSSVTRRLRVMERRIAKATP